MSSAATNTSSGLASRLESAWISKIDLQFDSAMSALTEVKAELGIPTGIVNEGQVRELCTNGKTSVVMDVLSLGAELERCFGSASRAREQVSMVDRLQRIVGVQQTFWVTYTKAMGLFASGDFTVAFEEFLRARARASTPDQHLIAEGNIILCLENQGLPYEQTKRAVQERLEKEPVSPAVKRRIQSQMFALELREKFRAGQIKDLLRKEKERTGSKVDQAFYYSLWVSQLPFTKSFKELAACDYERFSSGLPYQHYRDYRLRTLQGVLHPDERDLIKPTEFVERLYLWVWRWLSNSEQGSVEKVLVLLREFMPYPLSHRLTVEDTFLLTNALLWISLFDAPSTSHVERLIGQLETIHTLEFPLLRFENLTLHCLLALRDQKEHLAEEYVNTLRKHPLWAANEFWLPTIIEFARGKEKSLPPHLKKLETLLAGQRDARQQHKITIDMGSGEIKLGHTEHDPIFSPAMATALYLLKNYGTVSAETFVQLCFGIHTFDALIHVPKIQNLLTRLKSLFEGQLKLGMKNHTVFAQGTWEGFYFKQAPALSGFSQQVMDIERLMFGQSHPPHESNGEPMVMEKEEIFSKMSWDSGVTRNQIETFLGRPRSTVNRLLKRWIDEGKISRSGNTRSSRYFLKSRSSDHRFLGGNRD